jgi:cytochrome c
MAYLVKYYNKLKIKLYNNKKINKGYAMYKIILFLISVLLFLGCNASNGNKKSANLDGLALTKKHCSKCHNLDMPPKTSDKEIAPPLYTVVVHLKDWMEANSLSEKEAKFIEFVKDYAINPSKDKSYCDKKSLESYGLMPSLKGKITQDELEAIAKYIFNYYDQKKFLELAKERARIAALPLYKQVLETKDCKMCHNPNNTKTAPSFKMIANRYKNNKDAKEILKNSILNGSKGKWKGYILPMRGYKDIEPKRLDAFIDWILKGANDENKTK